MLRAMLPQFCQSTHIYSVQNRLFDIIKLSKSPTVNTTSEVIQTLDLIQGVALMHYASKKAVLFGQRFSILISLLSSKDSVLLVATLEALCALVIDSCETLRQFEQNGGLQITCSLLKHNAGIPSVCKKCIELLIVYCYPEEYPDAIVNGIQIAKTTESKQNAVAEIMGTAFTKKMLRIPIN